MPPFFFLVNDMVLAAVFFIRFVMKVPPVLGGGSFPGLGFAAGAVLNKVGAVFGVFFLN